MKQAQLDKCLAKWQMILRLEDWNISVALARQFELSDPTDQGTVLRLGTQKIARILILDPKDYPPATWSGDQDVEQTIVHELLHVHFTCVDTAFDNLTTTLYEQAVDAIAWALVNCERK